MMELPQSLIMSIDADVMRYRELRLCAARKRLIIEESQDPVKAKRREFRSNDQIAYSVAKEFLGGKSLKAISKDYEYKSYTSVKERLESWSLDILLSGISTEDSRWSDCFGRIFNMALRDKVAGACDLYDSQAQGLRQ